MESPHGQQDKAVFDAGYKAIKSKVADMSITYPKNEQ